MTKYTHLKLNHEVLTPSGYYTPQKEVRLKYNGREAFYVLSQAVVEASCCGAGDFNSVLVPGYIVSWHAETYINGNPVSLVEPISDESARDAIRNTIKEKESVNQTEFW